MACVHPPAAPGRLALGSLVCSARDNNNPHNQWNNNNGFRVLRASPPIMPAVIHETV
jgi:hypothetical protein